MAEKSVNTPLTFKDMFPELDLERVQKLREEEVLEIIHAITATLPLTNKLCSRADHNDTAYPILKELRNNAIVIQEAQTTLKEELYQKGYQRTEIRAALMLLAGDITID